MVAPRAALRRLRQLVRLRPVLVRQIGSDGVLASRSGGVSWREYRFDDPSARCQVTARELRVDLPDPGALVRLGASGLLTGQIRGLTLRLATVPDWIIAGVRPPAIGRTCVEFTWRRAGAGVRLRLRWSQPYEARAGLRDAAAAVLRSRAWEQVSGPVYALDRTAWLAGTSTWPQGHPSGSPVEVARDPRGRALGPFLPSPSIPDGAMAARPVATWTANPYGRILVGAATGYQLTRGDGLSQRNELWLTGAGSRIALHRSGPALHRSLVKYAVVSVDHTIEPTDSIVDSLRELAACGVVFAARDEVARSKLRALGLVVVADPAEVDDLRGYALSVAASRTMAIAADASLRRTQLGGDTALPLPTVSVVLSSRRPDDIETCLNDLATQTYPAWEVVLGLHGYDADETTRERWRQLVGVPCRVVALPEELTFGMVLGQLSRLADGELLTKVDDDDRYGPNHLTDLVIAWHTSGADVVAKGSRFVYFPERDETIDRAWAAPEQFQVTPAGGTMLFSRATLQQFGGWSHAPKHVDTDLLIRVKSAGGIVYRTHALEYVYVRRSSGHTWHTDLEELRAQGERVYRGFPHVVVAPDYSPDADASPDYSKVEYSAK